MIYLLAEIKANPNCLEKAQALLESLIAPTHLEKGCESYQLFADQNVEGLFVMQEVWLSQAHLDEHLASTHFQNFLTTAEEYKLFEYVKLRPMNLVG
ncbi:antibiotic biosynthesis monooxygenase [Photobacterium iliopiscarium]|jgi:quinol monooxygenase YgiN|uniref:Antibiotic biosynthesis monooxygenase n=1 Tax=Photobacterium iliopiscarium TaxID=56192 RepID=A0A0D8PWU8_9GAMM|nr:putative quinol monooxygenase [Photobacterium iliopiscarium]KJG12120.1 antibiotic biosynthesis monooxygenase [Photobacterium iliopiscarium]KJG23083.1 antibiotic biosynthesis monooxygenase [Photobacterium iliopiscarium]MCD9466570.1 antibiotic biosynthesis monooxygenase [Photobacterium iliopiscarium]MCD9486895.1 antibiotic biosynthesis monooxygenase [Photobacterium iliopiscarium]MCF2243503.1 antibiotic biosynthesis monooxygenase [Photobacterium iliopiscarium]